MGQIDFQASLTRTTNVTTRRPLTVKEMDQRSIICSSPKAVVTSSRVVYKKATRRQKFKQP